MNWHTPIAHFAAIQAQHEVHRHACEVRYVAGLPTDATRTTYLEAVRRHRGVQAYHQLRRDVWRMLKPRKAA